ncbi:MAG TPA: FKBP-type peptidyl-prolyl cis-trans isomerase N-terminal domain-containing protein [bacterium]
MTTRLAKVLLTVFAVCWAAAVCADARAADQKTEESYALGYQFGENMRKLGLSVDQEALVGAVRDGLGGKAPTIGKDRYLEVYEILQRRIVTIQQRRAAEAKSEKAPQGQGANAPAATPGGTPPAPPAAPAGTGR